MYKPPSDEEQPVDKTRVKATRKASRPRQGGARRNEPEKPHKEFYADEHPEIPRIRRASLYKARVETLPGEEERFPAPGGKTSPHTSTSLKRVRKEAPPFHGVEEEKTFLTRSGKTSAYTQLIRKKKEMLPFTSLEENAAHKADTAAQERLGRQTGKQRRYNPVTPEPLQRKPGRKVATSRARKHLPGRISAPFFGHKRRWLLIGLLALLILLVSAPSLINALHNVSLTLQNNANQPQGVSIATLQSVPSNPHELVIQPPTSTHPAPPVLATSAYVLDAENATTYYVHNPFLHLPMLSTTKLMTAALAVQNGNLDQNILITGAMARDISQLSSDSALFGVKQGQTYTLRDLLYGLLFVSGNDAALVIAEALSGDTQSFVVQMNQKAQELGMHDTHFVNPHGLLNAGQYSCARDLAVLGLYSLSIPLLQQISGQKTYHIAAGGNHGARVLTNENQFLWWYPGVNAGKTGFDGVNDFVQVMMVTRNNRHMIGVVMHTKDWWTDMRDLMDYVSNDYTWVSPRDVDASGNTIPYDYLWNYFAKDTQQLTIPTANNGQYFVYTGYIVSGPILDYFNQQGGLQKFGYPTQLLVPDGPSTMKQQFQHGTVHCSFATNQCITL